MIIENEAGFVCENSDESIKECLLGILTNIYDLNGIKSSLTNKKFNNEDIKHKFTNDLIN